MEESVYQSPKQKFKKGQEIRKKSFLLMCFSNKKFSLMINDF